MSSVPPAGLLTVDATTPAVLVLPGPVTRDQVPGLCDDVRARLAASGAGVVASGAGVVVCDVAGLDPPGLATVDALARMQLAARRAGGRIRLRAAAPPLLLLLELVGLRFEVEGEAEEREPALGVQEAVETGDAAV